MLLLLTAAAAPPPLWTRPQLARLAVWLESAKDEGLGAAASDFPALKAAEASGDPALEQIASGAALRLIEAHRDGCCNAALRDGWHIMPEPTWPPASQALSAALARRDVDALFLATRPSHPYYRALAGAFATEKDPDRRATLAANLDRWRWMPRNLGPRYVLVNAAAFEAALFEDGQVTGRWAVVVGKTGSPTPVFKAMVTGVTFNPWWEIPPSIAAESVAAMVARRPAEAARKGYVLQNGRYRQRPGPANALGRMKLVMPNGFNVYLHDSPAQSLFAQDVRAYSHGCVRVGDALGLAATLLGGEQRRQEIDVIVASGATRTVPLEAPLPVYIAYFTAEPDGLGHVRYFPDVYGRDRGARVPDADGRCAA